MATSITNARRFYTLVIGAVFNLVVDDGVNPNHSYKKISKTQAEKYVKGELKKIVDIAGAKLVVTEDPEFADLAWDSRDIKTYFYELPVGARFYLRNKNIQFIKHSDRIAYQISGRYAHRRIEMSDNKQVFTLPS